MTAGPSRRVVVMGGVALTFAARRGEAEGRVFRIGIVSTINPRSAPQFVAFEDRLRELGFAVDRYRCIYRSNASAYRMQPTVAVSVPARIGYDPPSLVTIIIPALRAQAGEASV
jgi:hypothetical protein